ncbi:hypothetical protein C1H46_045821 [Malus baccata]|uniref:Uncharacterized protein n=1 Tax=Malus baccata TaxID=106549 RepID=A0A540K2Z5_MALBA|nr:hypothetical protein C1H46_045821 [Malus baccata]
MVSLDASSCAELAVAAVFILVKDDYLTFMILSLCKAQDCVLKFKLLASNSDLLVFPSFIFLFIRALTIF